MSLAAPRTASPGAVEDPALSAAAFRRIAAAVRREAGIHLAETKQPLVLSRLVRRVAETGTGSFERYCDLVEAHDGAAERRHMVEALTTNHTFFLREPHHFEHLERIALPALARRAREGGSIRLWSAGCSTGPEAYGLAIALLRVVPDAGSLDIRVLATDLDRNVLGVARQGRYDEPALEGLPAADRDRFFRPAGAGQFEARDALRRLIRFRELNLLRAWPMQGLFDAVFFRNVAIYFDRETREGVWERIAERIRPGGWLYAGHSERVTGPAAAALQHVATTTYRRIG